MTEIAPKGPSGIVTSVISIGGWGICAGGSVVRPNLRHLASVASRSGVATLTVRNSRILPTVSLRSGGGRRRLPAILALGVDAHGARPIAHHADVRHDVLGRPHEVAWALEVRNDVAAEHLDRFHDLRVRDAVDAHHQLVDAA